jgi:hypothetical protein
MGFIEIELSSASIPGRVCERRYCEGFRVKLEIETSMRGDNEEVLVD